MTKLSDLIKILCRNKDNRGFEKYHYVPLFSFKRFAHLPALDLRYFFCEISLEVLERPRVKIKKMILIDYLISPENPTN